VNIFLGRVKYIGFFLMLKRLSQK